MGYFFFLLICVVATEAVAELVTKSVFFEPLRSFLLGTKSRVGLFFSLVVSCPYCCSFWSSLFVTTLVFLFSPPFLFGVLVVDYILFLLFCHRFSNYLHDISDRYFIKQNKDG